MWSNRVDWHTFNSHWWFKTDLSMANYKLRVIYSLHFLSSLSSPASFPLLILENMQKKTTIQQKYVFLDVNIKFSCERASHVQIQNRKYVNCKAIEENDDLYTKWNEKRRKRKTRVKTRIWEHWILRHGTHCIFLDMITETGFEIKIFVRWFLNFFSCLLIGFEFLLSANCKKCVQSKSKC